METKSLTPKTYKLICSEKKKITHEVTAQNMIPHQIKVDKKEARFSGEDLCSVVYLMTALERPPLENFPNTSIAFLILPIRASP